MVLGETSFDGVCTGGSFPFGFRRQPRLGPACVSICLEVADVCHWCSQVKWLQSTQREFVWLLVAIDPIQWRIPLMLIDVVPTHGKPKFRLLIATVVYELEKLAVGDKLITNYRTKNQRLNALCDGFLLRNLPSFFRVGLC